MPQHAVPQKSGGPFACCSAPAKPEEKPKQPDPPKPPPAGWELKTSNSTGQKYYHHAPTSKSTWKFPTESEQAEAAAPAITSESPAKQELPAGWESQISKSTGKTYYLNKLTGETHWDLPTDPSATVVEGETPEVSAEKKAAKLITDKSNAGFEEGENLRAGMRSELTEMDNTLNGVSEGVFAAEGEAASAKAAADKAAEEAKATGMPEDELEAKVAQLVLASEKATAVKDAALVAVEEMKKSIKALRKTINGTSGDLVQQNAQLRKENEAYRELLGDKISGPLDLSGRKTISSKSETSPKPSTQPPASPSKARRFATPERGTKSDYNSRRAELLKARREFEQQKRQQEEAAEMQYEPKKKIALDDTDAVRMRA